jgi:hypothetical protein
MYVQRYIVTPSRNHCCHGNATIVPFLFVCIYVAVNNIKVFSFVMQMQQWFLVHCCRGTKYFVLLLTVISINYYERESVLLNGTIFGTQIIEHKMCVLILFIHFV